MNAGAPADLLARLRESTAAQHRELEAWVDPAQRFATRENYVAYLREIHVLFHALETALGVLPWREIGFDFDARRKTALIARDLAFLGVEAPTATAGEPIAFASLAAGFGGQYVLEGSTLGGQMILPQLEKRGIGAESGAAFFACYGARTAEMWKVFKAAATKYCADEARQAEAETAARETFAYYRRGVGPMG